MASGRRRTPLELTDLKQVSKALRSAVRRALTRGRWRPLRDVSVRSPYTWGLAVTPLETFRAAWEIEPGLAFLELADWYPFRRREHTWYPAYAYRPDNYETDLIALFFSRVVPSFDDFARVVAACEGPPDILAFGWQHDPRYAVCRSMDETGTTNDTRSWENGLESPAVLLRNWARRVGCSTDTWSFTEDITLPMLGSGLENWKHCEHASNFLEELLPDVNGSSDVYRCLSANWRDRRHADAFVFSASRHREGGFSEY